MPVTISRAAYADMFGPTVGDRVRLADTSLFIQAERDLATYGEEMVFGPGQVVRDGMGQGQTGWAEGAPDTVITNALILDHTGIVKADVSIRDGVIGSIGKAGNPAIQPGVTIPIGPGTEIIAGAGKILTTGGVDASAQFVGPQQIEAALASGITTMLGGGTGPATGGGTAACTPGAWHIGKLIDAADALPMNFGFLGKGSASVPNALDEQIAGGACALMLSEAFGATPAAIGCCLAAADAHDVQVMIDADTRNEAGFVATTIAAFEGRTIVASVTGARRGHAPDLLELAGLPNVLPLSTGGSALWARYARTDRLVAAEDALHDIGALSIMALGGFGAGCADGLIRRVWQTADKMKRRQASSAPSSDNLRARRYIAKYTINPAIALGVSDHVGSVEIGKLADLVLWSPAFFGIRPDLVLKGGIIASASAGSRPAAQPMPDRPMFGACAGARVGACLTFVSQTALDKGLQQRLRTQRRLVAVKKTRGEIDKQSMILNDMLPELTVNSQTCRVSANGESLSGEPATSPAMAQRYFMF